MNVSAADRSSGKEKCLTVTNDKGRLSAEEIERLANEAVKYRAELGCLKENISAKNRLESYAWFIMQDGEKKCSEVFDWLDRNQAAEKAEFEYQREALEKAVVQKLCAAVDATEQDLLRAFMINHCPS